jgi:alpha-L-fucosidase
MPELDWFTHDRFGLFVHWGLYALGARHEWLMIGSGRTCTAK